ncbi:transposase [Arthrobacter sp. N199823]|uniref:transposase n=1 Tax=Arthrobacter sp. N199823 TaxID=2058895 RepID=UPI0035BE7B64
MQKRDVFADPATRIRALEGNHRLHHKWEVFDARKKRSVIANTAVARELASWCWSLAAPLQQGEQAPGGRMNAA